MKVQFVTKAIVVNGQGKVLLLRRSKTAPRRALQWDLPGGLVDDDDASYAAACAREISEEADIRVEPDELTLVRAESEAMDLDGETMAVTWLYYVLGLSKTPAVTLSYEHDKFQWLDLDAAITASGYDRQIRTLQYIRDNRLLADI